MGYLGGFKVTMRKALKWTDTGEVVTREYYGGKGGASDLKRDKPDRMHGRHVLNRYEDGMEKCIGCELCAGVCPANCIYVESKLFEFSFTNRSDAIYTKSELLVDDEGKPQRLPWEDWREGEDVMTSAWMRATSPGGSAEFEGIIAWSEELGYGTRAAEGGQPLEAQQAAEREALAAAAHDDHGHDDHGHDAGGHH